MLTSILILALAAAPQTRTLAFDDAGWKHADPKARVESLGGRTALRLTTGMSTRRDVEFTDGTIEFDLWSTGERAFAYIHFRMQSEEESEGIYFRLHKSRLPDAIQYEPVYQALANWQLFHGPESTASVDLPAGRWIHVRLVVKGEKAALFVGDAKLPTLAIPRLLRGAKGGFIALRSFLGANIQGEVEPPSSFANLVVRPGDEGGVDFTKIVEKPAPPLPGLVTTWRLTPAFEPPQGIVAALPATPMVGAEKVATVLPSGLLVIGRELTAPKARRYATVASIRVRAAAAGVKRLKLGYSDEASVFLNGQILFSGDARYIFNFPRQEGLIHLDQAAVYLPLREGVNEVRIVVSETFGGWGIMGQFDDPTGLTVEP